MNEQFKELKEYIETIITTSKLLGYQAEVSDDGTIIETEDGMVILAIFLYLEPTGKVLLQLSHGHTVKRMIDEPQEEKLNYLQNRLQAL